MPIPPYVAHLRTMVGRGAALDARRHGGRAARRGGGADEVLLVRRSDNGAWTPVTGIVDPGEHPHVTAVREVEEEACVVAEVERLVWVSATGGRDARQRRPRAVPRPHVPVPLGVGGAASGLTTSRPTPRWFALDALPEMADGTATASTVRRRQPADVRLGPRPGRAPVARAMPRPLGRRSGRQRGSGRARSGRR